MNRLVLAVSCLVACGSPEEDKPPAPKLDMSKLEKKVEQKVEPDLSGIGKMPPKRKAPPAKVEATDIDKKLALTIGDRTEAEWKAPTGETVKVAVKQRVEDKLIMADIFVDGTLMVSISTGVEQGDIHMEARSAAKRVPDGVLVVLKAIKVTGKPADSYRGQFLTWDAGAKRLKEGRWFEFSY
jgi:hypothetical protein